MAEVSTILSTLSLCILGIFIFFHLLFLATSMCQEEDRWWLVVNLVKDIISLLALSFMLSLFYSHYEYTHNNKEGGKGSWGFIDHSERHTKDSQPAKKVEEKKVEKE